MMDADLEKQLVAAHGTCEKCGAPRWALTAVYSPDGSVAYADLECVVDPDHEARRAPDA